MYLYLVQSAMNEHFVLLVLDKAIGGRQMYEIRFSLQPHKKKL
jgi:hypothetical protein